MSELLVFIQNHWAEWFFCVVSAGLGLFYRNISRRLKVEHEKNKAIANGVQAILRDGVVNNYNKYTDRGHCPIYAKDSIRKQYESYHQLGGNGVITELYNKILEMPEKPAEREVQHDTKMD